MKQCHALVWHTQQVLRDVRLTGPVASWQLVAIPDGDEGCCIRVEFVADGALQKGRKWRISNFMVRTEIIQTAFKAVLVAMEHEVREKFLYRGKAVFGPHVSIDALWEACDTLDVRAESSLAAGGSNER